MEEEKQIPSPSSEPAQEGNSETACIPPLLYSLDFQAVVQAPGMELLDTAVNKKFLSVPVPWCGCALQVSLGVRGPVFSISRARLGYSHQQVKPSQEKNTREEIAWIKWIQTGSSTSGSFLTCSASSLVGGCQMCDVLTLCCRTQWGSESKILSLSLQRLPTHVFKPNFPWIHQFCYSQRGSQQ